VDRRRHQDSSLQMYVLSRHGAAIRDVVILGATMVSGHDSSDDVQWLEREFIKIRESRRRAVVVTYYPLCKRRMDSPWRRDPWALSWWLYGNVPWPSEPDEKVFPMRRATHPSSFGGDRTEARRGPFVVET